MPEIKRSLEKQSTHACHDEHILVVPRQRIFDFEPAWSGIKKVNFDHFLPLIKQYQEFQPRSIMESDSKYKQIIPYLVFCHKDKYFLMQRSAKSSEKRLQNKYSLGIGGHIRQEDMASESLFDWARREFYEEVNYDGSFTIKPLGILNDDSNEVGQVHLGFVFLLLGDSADISIKSELKSGKLLAFSELKLYFTYMETWSQMVFEFLIADKK